MTTTTTAVVVIIDFANNATIVNAVRSQTSALAKMVMTNLVSLHLPLLLLLESFQVCVSCSRFSSQFALKRFESTDVGLVLEWRKRE